MVSVTLQAGPLRAALRPDLGGCLAGLWWHDEPLLRSTPPEQLAGPRLSACYALLPYSNRIGHCRFDWDGERHTTQPNFPDHPHSLHGVGWVRPWTVHAQQSDRVELVLQHTPDADWPFAFEARQRITLADDAMHCTLAVRNLDTRAQPVGLGWHPYFPHQPQSRIRAAVSGQWMPEATGLPVGRRVCAPLDAAARDLRLDHCFDGWTGEAWVNDARHRLQLTSSTRHLVVYTPEGLPFFCVEPVSHVNNAVQAADPVSKGLVRLEPGESVDAWFSLRRMEPA